METEQTFTRGPILSTLLKFALPVLLALLLQAHQLSGDLLVRNVHMLESGPQAAVFEFHGDSPCLLFKALRQQDDFAGLTV